MASTEPPPRKDFFISYNQADQPWAEWIAWQLEAKSYTTVLQAWDFRPGSNFVLEMQRAAANTERTIAVLSPDYLSSLFTQPEWAAALARDPTGQNRTLIPVRVQDCDLKGLWPQAIYINLVGLPDEERAKETLLAGVRPGRAKPTKPPGFPGAIQHTEPPKPQFPGIVHLTATMPNPTVRLEVHDTPPAPLPPHVFTGTCTFSGLRVVTLPSLTAWIDGTKVASAILPTRNGNYRLVVHQPSGASFSGKPINFRVGNRLVNETRVWQAGGATVLNLTA